MFELEGDCVVLPNGAKMPVHHWLAEKSLHNKAIRQMLEQGAESGKAAVLVQNEKLCFEAETETDLAALALGLCKLLRLPINRCENCGCFFVPQQRVDEKYCAYPQKDCRKKGASNTFQKTNAKDAGYRAYTRYTKHIRYLKHKGALSESVFQSRYAAAKELFLAYRAGRLQAEALETALAGEPKQAEQNGRMESYLL